MLLINKIDYEELSIQIENSKYGLDWLQKSFW